MSKMKASNVGILILVIGILINIYLLLSERMGWMKPAPLDLPPNAHDVKLLGNGWHTFRLYIGGKDRLFLRRLYPNYNNTESISEILDPTGD